MPNKLLHFPKRSDAIEYYEAKYQEALDALKELTSKPATIENAKKFKAAQENVDAAWDRLMKQMDRKY